MCELNSPHMCDTTHDKPKLLHYIHIDVIHVCNIFNTTDSPLHIFIYVN